MHHIMIGYHCKIRGSHSGADEYLNSSEMWGCDAVSDCVVPEILKDDSIIIIFKVKHSIHSSFFFGVLDPKVEGTLILSNVWNYAP
jgi:hypothetical protein